MSAETSPNFSKSKELVKLKKEFTWLPCLSFCGLGLLTKSLCQIFMNSAEEFWQSLSRKHVFCENWLSVGYTLQFVGPICLTIEGCPKTLVTNYHSAMLKIPLECTSCEKFIFSATAGVILVATRMLHLCLDGVVWHGVNLQIWPKWIVPIIRSGTVHVLSKNGVRAVDPAHIWVG